MKRRKGQRVLSSFHGCTSSRCIEIEFSLALNNRTGKYFVCSDLIEAVEELTESIWYWRMRSATVPYGLTARILGRLMTTEYVTRISYPALDAALGRRWRANPTLFTDPLQVLFYRLKSSDIILCHDVGPVTHPHLYADGVEEAYAKVFKEVREARPHMLFVSQNSQAQFHRLYGNEYASSSVVYPPIRVSVLRGELEPIAGISDKFLLTVGAVGSRKNQAMCSRAFQRSGLADQGFSYVICGGAEPGYDDVVSAANAVNNVLFTGYVTDSQLRWLYSRATGFVLPSLLEGFGLPAAEAVAAGLIPLVTEGGTLHELTGNSAVLVDPTDIDSIAHGMRALVEFGCDERKERLTALQGRIQLFTRAAAVAGWRSCIQGALGASGVLIQKAQAM
jgi:glycosyltransferase involved in cell wall biosynthesis